MEGEIELQEGFFGFWTVYYAILHKQELVLCSEKCGEKVHTLNLNSFTVSHQPGLTLIELSSKERVWKLRSSSPELSQRWVAQIRRNLDKAESSLRKSQLNRADQQLMNALSQIWQIQAEVDAAICLLKSKVEVSRTEETLLDKISKLTDTLKRRITAVAQQAQGKRPASRKASEQFNDFQDFAQDSFASYSLRQGFTYSLKTNTQHPKSLLQQPHFNKSLPADLGLSDPLKTRLLLHNQVFKQTASSITTAFRRGKLPAQTEAVPNVGLIGLAKKLATTNLSRVTFPVGFNLPLSQLQSLASKFQFKSLLQKASTLPDYSSKMAFVLGFELANYATLASKKKKYFNPLLYQTYQMMLDNNTRFIAEQVSHHPPISAYSCTSPSFSIEQTFCASSHFRITYVNISQWGKTSILLKTPDYSVKVVARPALSLTGLFAGDNRTEISGQLRLESAGGDKAVLNFSGGGWISKDTRQVEGYVQDSKGVKKLLLTGVWDQYLNAVDPQTTQSRSIYKLQNQELRPEEYFLNGFQKQLNHLNVELLKKIAPTDSRLRPDQRALEFGLLDLAASQKHRLEEAQRGRKKQEDQTKRGSQPRWFSKVSQDEWRFEEEYWTARARGNFGDVADIF